MVRGKEKTSVREGWDFDGWGNGAICAGFGLRASLELAENVLAKTGDLRHVLALPFLA